MISMYCAGGSVELADGLLVWLREEEGEELEAITAFVTEGDVLLDDDELGAGQAPKHRILDAGTSLSKSPPTYLMS